jgi:hypothetical protein
MGRGSKPSSQGSPGHYTASMVPASAGVRAQGEGADGPGGERGARPAESAGTPRGGEVHPEGCGARTAGRRPVSACVYDGAAAAERGGALERGMRWHARRRAFWHEMLRCRLL